MRTWLACCLLLLLCAVPAVADPYDDAVGMLVDRAVAAATGGDKAALAEIAGRPSNPSGWEVLEVLCVRGHAEAAAALAAAAGDAHREGMTAYVASRRKSPLPKETLERFLTARRLAVQGKFDEALPVLDELAKGPASVVGTQAARIAAGAHKRADDIPAMIDALAAGARHARDIGWREEWIRRAYEGADQAIRIEDLARGETLAREAVAAARAIGHEGYLAQMLVTLAHCLSRRGLYTESPALWRESLALFEKLGERAHVAVILGNLGTDLTLLGRLEEALEIQERALKLKEELGDELSAASTLHNLSVLLFELGRYDEAWAKGEEALKRKRDLGDPREIAISLAGLGNRARKTGDYAGGLARLEEALAVAREAGIKEQVGSTLGMLGDAWFDLGDYEKAVAAFEEGRAVLEEIGVLEHASHIVQSHASLLLMRGEHEQALERAQELLAMRETLANPRLMSTPHQLLAAIYDDWGRPKEALPHVEKALGYARAEKDEVGVAYVDMVLGGVHAQLGKDAEARKVLESALAVARAHDDARLEVAVLGRRVEVALRAKRYDDAIELADEAAGRMRTQFRHLAQEERARAGERWNEALVFGLEAARLAKRPKDAFRILEAGRAAALREALGGGAALRAATLPKELQQASGAAAVRLASASRALRTATERGRVTKVRAAKAELEAARAAVEALAARLEREAKAAAAVIQPEPAGLKEVQRLLGKDRALVLFTAQGEEASALVVRAKGVRHVALGPTASLRESCEALYLDGEGQMDAKVLAALEKRLVAPLRLGTKDKALWISPDGPMSYVPFGLLVGDRDVAYLPSATTAVQLAPELAKSGEGVLALGDPAYGEVVAGGAGALRSAFRLTPLPGTREEAKAIGDAVLLGREATEAGFRAAVAKRPRWRAVHLACHGLVDPDRPSFCALALTPSTDDDGFLTALEIMQQPIQADLVVLSACETGRGRVYGGEGIVGLTRAFMLAGAPRVLVSLWKVDDGATRFLMESFYRHWTKGTSAAAALRKAQHDVRTLERKTVDREASRAAGKTVEKTTRPYEDPRFWAAWVLWGAGS